MLGGVNIRKKGSILVIIMQLILLSAFTTVGTNNQNVSNIDYIDLDNNSRLTFDEKDQFHEYHNTRFAVDDPIHYDLDRTYRAQSFQPEKNMLTKIEVYLESYYATGEIWIGIIENENYALPTGGDVISGGRINAEDLPVDGLPHWILIDVPDVSVIKDELYFIVLKYESGEMDSLYWHAENDPAVDYARGRAIEYNPNKPPGDEWDLMHNFVDFCFRTYGYDQVEDLIPPDLEIISPKDYFYIMDIPFFPILNPFCIGKTTIEVDASDESGVSHVLFEVDGIIESDDSIPYEYVISGMHFGDIKIRVTAFDIYQNVKTEEKTITLFCLGLI
jgi:hypothetical protein